MKRDITLDPRTKLLLLLVSNVLLFSGGRAAVVYSYIAFLAAALLLYGCYKPAAVFVAAGAVLTGIHVFVLPVAPRIFIALFSIFVNYTLKMFPCLMAGALLVMTTSLHDIVLAMRRCRLPQGLIITLSVTIRYFPAVFEEIRHIRNAMKLRTIPVSERLECFAVPFMMSVTTTAEELSAAAVTRGIENPVRKTSIAELCFGKWDYVFLTTEIMFVLAAVAL